MKKVKLLLFSFMLLLLVVSGCSANDGETQKASERQVELTISAAVSLQETLNDIKLAFEKENPNVKITYNYGSSGALQQQISQGAPVDLFFLPLRTNLIN